MGRFGSRSWKVIAIVAAIMIVPTAAWAAIGAFTSTTTTAAVTGTSSSALTGARAVYGNQTGGGANTRYGVVGNATGTGGIGVQGTGTKNGVVSNGPFLSTGNATIATGKTFACGLCVTSGDLASGSVTSTKLAAGSVTPAALSAAAKLAQPLASGESESGMFAASGGTTAGAWINMAINFAREPANNLGDPYTWRVVPYGAVVPHCPGAGMADAGYLCLYEDDTSLPAPDLFGVYSYDYPTLGAVVIWQTAGPDAYVSGVYTLTST